MPQWWESFFDSDYLLLWQQLFTDEVNAAQAAGVWSLLDLQPGCRVLDAPCGWGRIAKQLALLGAEVVGVDQSPVQIGAAEEGRGAVPADRLRYVCHDLRQPLAETGFDAACNIFTSFGYGTVDDDLAMFRNLREALRPGGRAVVETNHRDMMCAFIARGTQASRRLPDGTLFIDQPRFDPLEGVVHLHWYWSGPMGSGEKHAVWRCYTPTQIAEMLRQAGLRVEGAYQGLSKEPYRAEGPEAGGRLALVAVRD